MQYQNSRSLLPTTMQSTGNGRYYTSTPENLLHHRVNHQHSSYPSTNGQSKPVSFPDIQHSHANDSSFFSIPSELLHTQNCLTSTFIECGQNFVGQAKETMDHEIQRYINASRIYSYFSVDTGYVIKKLILLLFPFIHKDWSVGLQMKPNAQEPVLPKHNLNAPDLYIPLMAFITYVLVGGFSLGLQGHFTPEALCLLTTTSLFWLIVEILSLLIALFLLNINTVGLTTFDILAFSSYKYFGMSVTIVLTFLYPSTYYIGLLYFSFAMFDFLVCSLKIRILRDHGSLPRENGHILSYLGNHSNSKLSEQKYFLPIVAAVVQPMAMWWLTRRLALP